MNEHLAYNIINTNTLCTHNCNRTFFSSDSVSIYPGTTAANIHSLQDANTLYLHPKELRTDYDEKQKYIHGKKQSFEGYHTNHG